MSRKVGTLLLGVGFVATTACAISALLITRAAPKSPAASTPASVQSGVNRGSRNLFLQPEALRVSRRLGKRFDRSSRATSTSVGTLTLAGERQSLTLTRRQTETGESVELVVGGRVMAWSDRDGTTASSGIATDPERLLVERLTLDSPDQFVLAQLRGASYFIVARNVRPTDANDGYRGALWNVVRVDEPHTEASLRPRSTWRLYYLNVQTGLPDRIEYQLNGEEIRVEFLAWADAQGEKTPALIRWSRGGQTIMEYQVTNVSHNQ